MRFCQLVAVSHYFFLNHQRGAVLQNSVGAANCGVYTLNLHGFHFQVGVWRQFRHRVWVHNALTAAIALAVMLFDIAHAGPCADEKAVQTVVLGIART